MQPYERLDFEGCTAKPLSDSSGRGQDTRGRSDECMILFESFGLSGVTVFLCTERPALPSCSENTLNPTQHPEHYPKRPKHYDFENALHAAKRCSALRFPITGLWNPDCAVPGAKKAS